MNGFSAECVLCVCWQSNTQHLSEKT